jgi:hypothetical protein
MRKNFVNFLKLLAKLEIVSLCPAHASRAATAHLPVNLA